MRRFLILTFTLVILYSCSESPTAPSEPQVSFLIGDYDILLFFKERYFTVSSTYEIKKASLKLNDIDVGLTWKRDDYLREWYCSIDTDTMASYLTYNPGMELHFELIINNLEFSDKIYLSDKQKVTLPEFDFFSDYSFTWELEDIPKQQTIVMFLDDGSNDIRKYWHLDGSQRDFTISKDYYKNYNQNELELDLILETYNKVSQGKHIAISNMVVFGFLP